MMSILVSSPRRRLAALTVCLVLVGLLTWWLWPASGPNVVPGTVQAHVLSPDEVSAVLGTTVVLSDGASEPPAALSADPASCAVAVGPASRAVYTPGWTVFGSVTYQDSAAVADHVVIQVEGVYPNSDQASAVFRALTEGVEDCRTAVRTGADQQTSTWSYHVTDATPDTLVWTAFQDEGAPWACSREARLTGARVLQVAVCQAGDGKTTVSRIADEFTARVGR